MRLAVENDLLLVGFVTGLTNRGLQMLITSLIICFSLSSRPLTASKTLVSKTYTERRYCKIDSRES